MCVRVGVRDLNTWNASPSIERNNVRGVFRSLKRRSITNLKLQLERTKSELKDQKRAFNTRQMSTKLVVQISAQLMPKFFHENFLWSFKKFECFLLNQNGGENWNFANYRTYSIPNPFKLFATILNPSIAHRFVASNRYKRANTCVHVYLCATKTAHKHNHTIETREKGKQIQYKIELLNVCFTINNQQRKSNTLDGSKMIQKQTCRNTKSTLNNVT